MGFLFVRFCSAISQPLRKWLKRLLKRLKPSRNSFISLIAWTYSKDNMCLSLCVWVCVWKKKRKRGDKDLIRHVAERQIDHVYTLWEEKKSWLFIESERGRVRKSKRQGSLTVSTFSFFLVSRIERTRIFFYSPPPFSHIDCWRRDNEMRQLKKGREKRGSRWQQVQWPVCRVTITRSIDRVKQLSRRWQALCGRVSR